MQHLKPLAEDRGTESDWCEKEHFRILRIGMFFDFWQSIQYTIWFTVIYMHIGVHLSMSGWPVGFVGLDYRLSFYGHVWGQWALSFKRKAHPNWLSKSQQTCWVQGWWLGDMATATRCCVCWIAKLKGLGSNIEYPSIFFKSLSFQGSMATRWPGFGFLLLVTVASKEQHAKPSRRSCCCLCLHWSLYTSTTTILLNHQAIRKKTRVWKWQVAKSGPNPEGGFLVEVIRIQGKEWWGIVDPVVENMGVAKGRITHSNFLMLVFCVNEVYLYIMYTLGLYKDIIIFII